MTPAPAIFLPGTLAAAPIPSSGLPPRIQTALRAHGIITLKDLTQPLPECKKMAAEDRALLERVADYIRHLPTHNAPPPLHLSEWLRLFLPPRQVDLLETHFGLQIVEDRPIWRVSTLQQTGNRLGISRERVRQLLRAAYATLSHPLPQWAAIPICRAVENVFQAAGGVMNRAQLEQQKNAVWAGYTPVGVFHLLAEWQPEKWTIYRGFFSLLPAARLEQAARALQDRLRRAGRLLTVAEIARDWPVQVQPPAPLSAEPLIRILARHASDILATVDGRIGLAARDGTELLRELLLTTGETSLRTLQAELNARLWPESRRGSGYIRDALQHAPRIRRTAPGRYALTGNIQTSFPL